MGKLLGQYKWKMSKIFSQIRQLCLVIILVVTFTGCSNAQRQGEAIPPITGVVTNVEYLMGNNRYYMVIRFDDKRVFVRKGWIMDIILGKEYEFTLVGDPNYAEWDRAKELR